MKTALIIFLIYLSGCFCSYFMGRKVVRSWGYNPSWTTKDRLFVITTSVFSYLSVVAEVIVYETENNNDKTPATW